MATTRKHTRPADAGFYLMAPTELCCNGQDAVFGYVCTRFRRHDGPHAAHLEADLQCATWPQVAS